MKNYDYYPNFINDFGDEIPASPRINLQLTDPDFQSDSFLEIKDSILDSGADRTLIRIEILHGIPISPSGVARTVPGLGRSGDLLLIPYEVGLVFNSFQLFNVSVFGYLGDEDMILGRDILNSYSIQFNGPKLQFTVKP